MSETTTPQPKKRGWRRRWLILAGIPVAIIGAVMLPRALANNGWHGGPGFHGFGGFHGRHCLFHLFRLSHQVQNGDLIWIFPSKMNPIDKYMKILAGY